MKRVYIQIIDPLNGTCVNACHEYPVNIIKLWTKSLDSMLELMLGTHLKE